MRGTGWVPEGLISVLLSFPSLFLGTINLFLNTLSTCLSLQLEILIENTVQVGVATYGSLSSSCSCAPKAGPCWVGDWLKVTVTGEGVIVLWLIHRAGLFPEAGPEH